MDFDFPQIHDAVADAVGERMAIITKDRRFTYAELAERTRRLANHLLARGLRVRRERSTLANHESGQAHIALYLHNGNEYIEGMLGAFKARVAPLNVNYRYVEEELLYLFDNAKADAVIFHSAFAPNIERIRDRLPGLRVLLQVADHSGHALVDGAEWYEEALAAASPDVPDVTPSPDDLYILYTGGTTGMPKGVLWRSADIFAGAMGGRKLNGEEYSDLDEILAAARANPGTRSLLGPPLMHGAAQWISFMMMTLGNTLVFPNNVEALDPDDFLSTIEREKIGTTSIVGDAFARPLLDQMQKKRYDLSSLFMLGSGGAPFSANYKRAFLDAIPNLLIMDAIGSSETGAQASNPSTKDSGVSTGDFKPNPDAGVISEDMTRILSPGDDEVGWFTQKGRVPLGYLGDEAKTARTFPTVEGIRLSVPGDRARYREDGSIEVLGRDSVTINSGGEKIFAEEVEGALKQHPDVFDTVVAGRASERWGQEVVAIVALREGAEASDESLLDEARKHIARYKLPKQIIRRDVIVRSPSGKADYRWAKEQAESETQ